MEFIGTVKDGAVALPLGVSLPEGASVSVVASLSDSARDPFVELIEEIAKPRQHLPDDFAINHDYYLHGVSRKQSPRQGRWLADTTAVELSTEQASADAEQLAALAAETHNLPIDLAANHNHYLHGVSKS